MKEIIDIVMLGGSTAFYEIMELVYDINADEKSNKQYQVIAILDDDVELHGKFLDGIEIVGGLELAHNYPNSKLVFGIGSIKTHFSREEIIRNLNIPENRFETLIHPNVKIYNSAKIGYGCIIHSGNKICHEVYIDSFVIMTYDSIIGNFTRINKFCSIANKVVILSNTIIEKNVYIGTGSIIGENIKIGSNSIVGMGTIIRKSVNNNTFIMGNPHRKMQLEQNDSDKR